MCDQNSKAASLGRFIMPILQGAAAGAAAAPGPSTGLSAPGFGTTFFRGFGAAQQAQQQRALIEQRMLDERFQRGHESIRTNLAIEAAQRAATEQRHREEQMQAQIDATTRLRNAQELSAERALLSPTTYEEGGQEYRGIVNKETGLLKPVTQEITKPTGIISGGKFPVLGTQTTTERVRVPKKQNTLTGESLLRYMAAQGDQSAQEAVIQKDNLAKEKIKIAERRAELAAQNANLPRGTVYPELDSDGNTTGKFVQVDPRNQRITVFESSDASGIRIKPQTDASKNREKALTIVGNMITNIRKASNGLQKGENIAENIALLNSQMATFGQIARGLSGEVGVLTDPDINRIKSTVPGVITSLLAGYNDTAARYVATQISNLEDIFQKVEAAQKKGIARPRVASSPILLKQREKYDSNGNVIKNP